MVEPKVIMKPVALGTTAVEECNICFEDILSPTGPIHGTNPCRLFSCCESCAVVFLVQTRKKKGEPTECPGGCGALVTKSDFQRFLGYTPGDTVSARWRGGKGWFPGVVTHINDDGTFNIEYDDGDRETSVPKDMIKVLTTEALTRRRAACESAMQTPATREPSASPVRNSGRWVRCGGGWIRA